MCVCVFFQFVWPLFPTPLQRSQLYHIASLQFGSLKNTQINKGFILSIADINII